MDSSSFCVGDPLSDHMKRLAEKKTASSPSHSKDLTSDEEGTVSGVSTNSTSTHKSLKKKWELYFTSNQQIYVRYIVSDSVNFILCIE